MIKWINYYFGIDNTISVPIVISILVFVTGGFSKLILNWISSLRKNKNTRYRFASLIEKICNDLKLKTESTKSFYPEIKISHTGGWSYKYKPVSYLDIIYQIDFNEIHDAYYAKFKCSFSREDKEDAFHKIWDTLSNIKFIESQIEKSLEGLEEKFKQFHDIYRKNLSLYQEFHEDLIYEINGTSIPKDQTDLVKYLENQEDIWKRWHDLNQGEREFTHVTYEKIVNPIFKLNQKYPEVEHAHNSNKYILTCEHAFAEMKSVLMNYHTQFKGIASQYENSNSELKSEIRKIK